MDWEGTDAPDSSWSRLGTLAAFVGICFLVAALATWATTGAVETWYPTLEKPAWTPPSWVFGPVWTVLYGMIAVAGWLAWEGSLGPRRTRAMVAWGTQLTLNVAWSGIFFGLQAPAWALVEIALLVLAILWTIAVFHRIETWAAGLLVPYLLWVLYAASLNAGIWMMN